MGRECWGRKWLKHDSEDLPQLRKEREEPQRNRWKGHTLEGQQEKILGKKSLRKLIFWKELSVASQKVYIETVHYLGKTDDTGNLMRVIMVK